jgi:hypothetical protein
VETQLEIYQPALREPNPGAGLRKSIDEGAKRFERMPQGLKPSLAMRHLRHD